MFEIQLDDESNLRVVVRRQDRTTECYILAVRRDANGKRTTSFLPVATGRTTRYARDHEDRILARWLAFTDAVKQIENRGVRARLYENFIQRCRVPWNRHLKLEPALLAKFQDAPMMPVRYDSGESNTYSGTQARIV